MTNSDRHLLETLTYYAAGTAYADWLSGNNPRAIYRLDKFPASSGQTIVNRAKRLVVVGAKFKPIAPVDLEKRSEVRKARTVALSQASVVLGGIAGLAGLPTIHKLAVQPAFHLTVDSVNRAAMLLAAAATSPDIGTPLAFDVLEQLIKKFEEPVLKERISILARNLLRYGVIEGESLWEYMLGLEDLRESLPNTLVAWPSLPSTYISLRSEDAPAQAVDG